MPLNKSVMRVKIYGSRGSLPIFNNASLKYGGNTTCLRIFNNHIPENTALVLDAGSGFLAMGHDVLTKEDNIEEILTFFTHWHHDHILGLFHSPVLFIKKYKMRMFGPKEYNNGPREMMENMMTPPYFPIDIRAVRGHFRYHDIVFPGKEVILLHKKGVKMMDVEKFEDLELEKDATIKIKKIHYPISEFLVVKTCKTVHPNLTLSYRFEDKSTGKVFVFLTDHENQDGIPAPLVEHLEGAHLLIADCQYTRKKYDTFTAGYGHATADYVVKLAKHAGIKKVGLTHHDPNSTDADIDEIVAEARKFANDEEMKIFACADFMDVNI